jgi:tubulin epsilon
MIDMESSVIHSIIKNHPLRSLFSQVTAITDQPGSGNNWATGYKQNYPAHKEAIEQAIRYEMELADCLGSIMILHSTGGGTGSGVGTAITEELDFKRKMNVCVVPRGGGDVVTGAYNT